MSTETREPSNNSYSTTKRGKASTPRQAQLRKRDEREEREKERKKERMNLIKRTGDYGLPIILNKENKMRSSVEERRGRCAHASRNASLSLLDSVTEASST